MSTILLSGGASGANWLPLIFPIAAVLLILYAADHMSRYIKRRKESKQQLSELTTFEDGSGDIDHS